MNLNIIDFRLEYGIQQIPSIRKLLEYMMDTYIIHLTTL